ncbi:hypothetical protein C8Q78DRAFT_176690 [Trametes maxima]|nr:hypothetical protein C8Q78DRAFT_176690 [Trametes maxima]
MWEMRWNKHAQLVLATLDSSTWSLESYTSDPTMVAPHLLQNQNIIAGVLQSLDPGSVLKNGAERGECRRALARLAIVCRATSSPALDVLWKSIGTFKHLLFAFESYNKDRLVSIYNTIFHLYRLLHRQRFDDDISDEGWLRFQEYASRVRELHMGNKISEVHANVWTTLTRRCLDKPLLPSLERLTGFKLNAMSVCYAMILSPTIKHLSLETDVYSDAGAIDMAAKLLLPILGQLTTLVVDDKYYANNEERQGVSFWTLTNLRALTVTTKAILTIPIIQALAVFPHLRQLTLGIKSVPIVAETPERVEGFDQLRELSLSGSVTDSPRSDSATTARARQWDSVWRKRSPNSRRLCVVSRFRSSAHATKCTLKRAKNSSSLCVLCMPYAGSHSRSMGWYSALRTVSLGRSRMHGPTCRHSRSKLRLTERIATFRLDTHDIQPRALINVP